MREIINDLGENVKEIILKQRNGSKKRRRRGTDFVNERHNNSDATWRERAQNAVESAVTSR